jgi:hypothetical protein
MTNAGEVRDHVVSSMRVRVLLAAGLLLCFWGVLRAQKPFKEYPAIEYNDFPLPSDWKSTAEWTRARLKYPDYGRRFGGFGFGRDMYWTMDYPRSDRHLLMGVRRLTRVEARSVEQPVELDGTDDIYNWPFVYAVEVGHWELPDNQAAQLRDFLLRGGFLMTDDYHGTQEWAIFMDSMQRVLPDRPVVDLQSPDPIFHTIYDLNERPQVPGIGALSRGVTYERDGYEPRWRAIHDDKGRIIVAICHNMDLGDAWEHSDDPVYPEKLASLAYRIAMNYIVYDLTH